MRRLRFTSLAALPLMRLENMKERKGSMPLRAGWPSNSPAAFTARSISAAKAGSTSPRIITQPNS